jgi:hypothetical protein
LIEDLPWENAGARFQDMEAGGEDVLLLRTESAVEKTESTVAQRNTLHETTLARAVN